MKKSILSKDSNPGRVNCTRIITIAVLTICLFVTSLAAQEKTSEKHRTLKVGFYNIGNYQMMDENGKPSGYSYDFLQLLARYTNYKFEYVGYDLSWVEIQKMLLNGEIDLVTTPEKTPERERIFDFSDKIVSTNGSYLVVKKGDDRFLDGNYNGIRIGIKIGGGRNHELDEFIKARGITYYPVYYEQWDDLYAALQNGREIDAAYTSGKRNSPDEWILEEMGVNGNYVAVKKGNTELLSSINKAIAEMDSNSSGWRTKLKNKYYSVDYEGVVAFSGEERAYLDEMKKANRVLSVTMTPDCAPYSYFEDGVAKGIIPDIFAEVASRMGIEYKIIEPATRSEYYKLTTSGDLDIVLDGINDFQTIEANGREITDVYYSAHLGLLTSGVSVGDIKTIAQPSSSIFNEPYFVKKFYSEKNIENNYETLSDVAKAVRKGKVDAAYMLYYSAVWQENADVTNKLKSSMVPNYSREFVYCVNEKEDHLFLSSLNRSMNSLSEAFINSVVTANIESPTRGFSVVGFMYKNPLAFCFILLVILVVCVVAYFYAQRIKRIKDELIKTRTMQRFIGYLCESYDKVFEINIINKSCKQYLKHGDVLSLEIQKISHIFEDEYFENVHAEDRDRAKKNLSPEALKLLVEEKRKEVYFQARVKTELGDVRWFAYTIKAIPQDKEYPCNVILLIKDINEIQIERERNRKALVEALDSANSATQTKSSFLSSMSHEIRTPLNGVIVYMTIAENNITNSEKVQHCITNAGIAARHLLSIINDVLDVSSMESGKMKLSNERFDLKELVTGITAIFYQQCKSKNIKFNITLSDLSEEWVLGDSMRVNQILMNLMSNAVKFTSIGEVNLSVTQTKVTKDQVYIRFTVKDTGIGMSKEYMTRLFSPFEQESAQTAKKYGGTGLGMAITHNLVGFMQGKMDVESEQNVGTTFTVTLPFGRTDNTVVEKAQKDFSNVHVLVVDDLQNECEYVHSLLDRCKVNCETANSGKQALEMVSKAKSSDNPFNLCIIDWNMPDLNGVETTRLIHDECDPDIPIIIATAYDISEFEEEAKQAGAAKIISKPLFQSTLFDLLVSTYGKYNPVSEDEDTIPDLSSLKILLAEDNDMNVEVAKEILDLAHCKVEVASNGLEAVEMFSKNVEEYDAILMDVQMPELDGYGATREIRAMDNPIAKTIPIIAMTANAFAEDITASLTAGMNDHISKPIEPDRLFDVLKKYCKK